jgi:feruloyl esterase
MKRALTAILLAAAPGLYAASSCEKLTSLTVPHAEVTLAQPVGAGQFTPPSPVGPAGGAAFKSLAAFCRVAATLRPVADSEIKIEVWLPATGWNGKLEAVGNGAWAGSISYPAMATAIAMGYAAASTDTGHTGNSPAFIPGHTEKVTDFAWCAVHEMTAATKAITTAYYGRAIERSYFNGCSTGGRQALTEAQRFRDYDGIIAGAPAYYTTRLQGMQIWTAQAVHKDEASYIPPEKYALLHRAVLQDCDALDGVKDGVLEDPTRCRFDPAVLACKNGAGPDCLTGPQVEAVRKIYSGPANPRTEQNIFPGLELGSELGWATLAGPKPMSLAVEVYQYLVFHKPTWNYLDFDPAADFTTAATEIGASMNATNPNLGPNGHKLLLYHGWADPGIPPRATINYFNHVVDAMGGASRASDSVRLFMVPGMGHCRGGDGTDTFDPVAALDVWVTTGKAPDQIPASHLTKGVVDKTRPLCPYPEVTKYKGNGDTNSAANFTCQAP